MKIKKFLSALVASALLLCSLVIPVGAQTTAALTKAHYPTGVVINGSNLYWLAPEASGLTETKLCKLTNGAWSEGTTVTSPATIDDETAVYKLQFVYDGYSSEYVIQMNTGARGVNDVPFGYTWGSADVSYVSVTEDDRADGNHSLFIHTYEPNDNRRWVELAADGNLIPNNLTETGERYQVEFDYKTSTGFELWLNGKQLTTPGATNGWQHYTKIADWDHTERVDKTHELAFDASWYKDMQVDNIELYKIDENGNKTGSNLVPFDGTFESSNESAVNGLSNVTTTPAADSATISWTKADNVVATRVYNSKGMLVAELGDATSFKIDGLTAGTAETYKLASVYKGGYESAPVSVEAYTKGTLTKAYYPTGVTVVDSTIYWLAPTASGLTATKLYKLTNGDWSEGTTVTSPATIDDETAVYKLEFVYDGFSSEYVIQKNSSAKGAYGLPFGGSWGGVEQHYMGVVADDRAENNHSLFINSYTQGDNGRWLEFASNGTLIPNDLADTCKQYQVEFDYKSSTGTVMWLNGSARNYGATSAWTHKKEIINWNDGINDKTHEFGFEVSWYLNVQVDNLELYELDANGNKTGSNLVPFDGTFESSNESAVNGLSNVTTTPAADSATISWTKADNVVATRVYNSKGMLVAELGDATSFKIDGLTAGTTETYKLTSVYKGGYESAPVSVEAYTKGTLTKAYYPTGVTVVDSTIYWIAPTASGLTATKLYKLTNGAWSEGTTVTSPATIDDETAVYKLQFVYDGYSSEYVIQKNSSAKGAYGLPFGGSWGNVEQHYMGVVADDRAENNHSLFINSYTQGDNGRWLEFASNGTLIPNDLADTGKQYQVEFDYKSSTGTVMWLNGLKRDYDATSAWTHKTEVINWNDGINDQTHEFGFEVSWYLNVQVDNLELYELDANGNKTGSNLVPFDGTFESSSESAVNGLSNVYAVSTENGAVVNWAKNDNVLAVRMYDENGAVVAELGDATSLVTDKTAAELAKYKLAAVYIGGYESEAVAIREANDALVSDFGVYQDVDSVTNLANGEEYTLMAKVYNPIKGDKFGLLLAIYNADGSLSEVVSDVKTVATGETVTLSKDYSKAEFAQGAYAKAFVWNMNSMKPYGIIDLTINAE